MKKDGVADLVGRMTVAKDAKAGAVLWTQMVSEAVAAAFKKRDSITLIDVRSELRARADAPETATALKEAAEEAIRKLTV